MRQEVRGGEGVMTEAMLSDGAGPVGSLKGRGMDGEAEVGLEAMVSDGAEPAGCMEGEAELRVELEAMVSDGLGPRERRGMDGKAEAGLGHRLGECVISWWGVVARVLGGSLAMLTLMGSGCGRLMAEGVGSVAVAMAEEQKGVWRGEGW